LTFNIRINVAHDGENDWPHRRDLWVSTVRAFDPDLLGLQEVGPGQGEEIRKALADYEMFGGSRDGARPGEASSLLFRKSRFECVRDGVFWLSETPESPASKGWDAAFPRVVTWAELRDRSAGAKDAHFFYFNTHWDHKGEQARLQSAQLMRRRIEQIAGDAPVIVKGDFCCSDDSKAYQFLVNPTGVDAGKPRLIDSYREFHPQHEATDFTFHGFTGTNTKPSRIDWILHTPEFKAARCEIDRTNAQGRYPSDHFPVIAVLK
jgi:endonuclease/exonuclease/phosphatase family metal-dependent hydrolase